VAEDIARWVLIKQAEVQLELADEDSDPDAWSDFREFAFEDKDFLWLYSPELDGIEESEWRREHAVVNLKFSEWFKRFHIERQGAPHPLNLSTRTFARRRTAATHPRGKLVARGE
jgi:hypothetical protein